MEWMKAVDIALWLLSFARSVAVSKGLSPAEFERHVGEAAKERGSVIEQQRAAELAQLLGGA